MAGEAAAGERLAAAADVLAASLPLLLPPVRLPKIPSTMNAATTPSQMFRFRWFLGGGGSCGPPGHCCGGYGGRGCCWYP